MKFSDKLKKRTDFLFNKISEKNPLVIIYSLAPTFFFQKQKGRLWISDYLEKKGFIRQNKQEKKFKLGNLKIFYSDRLPTGDIISILLSREPFIKKNFLDNSLLDFEQPYEYGKVFIEKNDTVIDAGANIGLFSIFASQQIGTDGKVFSFEPITETNFLLNKNIKANHLTNIKSIPYALGEKEAEINFYVNRNKLVSSSSEIINQKAVVEKVQQTTLDNFVRNNNVGRINFIKVDIEGAERKFLDGAKKTIQKYKFLLTILYKTKTHTKTNAHTCITQ